MDVLNLIGRILYGGYFIYNGLNHLLISTDMLTGYAESKSVPSPRLAVYGSGILLLLGGFSVLLGLAPDIGIVLLIIFLIPTTLMIHDFWAVGGEAKASETINFTKNLALMGALLMFLAIPQPWPLSLGG